MTPEVAAGMREAIILLTLELDEAHRVLRGSAEEPDMTDQVEKHIAEITNGDATQFVTGLYVVCTKLIFWLADETKTTPEKILQRLGTLAAGDGEG